MTVELTDEKLIEMSDGVRGEVEFSKVSSLMNLRYKMTVELSF